MDGKRNDFRDFLLNLHKFESECTDTIVMYDHIDWLVMESVTVEVVVCHKGQIVDINPIYWNLIKDKYGIQDPF